MAPPYGHILDPLRHHRMLISLGAQKRDVERDAVSTMFYNYYLNIVGGYYTHIISVFRPKLEAWDGYLGTSPFVLVVPPVLGHFDLEVVLPRVFRVAFLPGKVAACR